MKRVWAIVPIYNEASKILHVLKDIEKYVDEIVVVNDCSTDNTRAVLRNTEYRVIHHSVNMGKGAALRTGCDYAYKKGAEKIVLMDGDGQHDASFIPYFLNKLKRSDIVFGYRDFSKAMPLLYRVGNWGLTKATLLFRKIRVKDTQCGFRAFNTKIYPLIIWDSNDYGIESEVIGKVAKWGIVYSEQLVPTIYLDKYKGTNVMDGINIFCNHILRRK